MDYNTSNNPNQLLMDNIFTESKSIYSLFNNFQSRIESNSNCLFLNSIDRFIISKHLIPYLQIEDILSFRLTCRAVDECVNSTVSLVAYYKVMQAKLMKSKGQSDKKTTFSNIKELSEYEEIQKELINVKVVSSK